jgi:hypothetical protein
MDEVEELELTSNEPRAAVEAGGLPTLPTDDPDNVDDVMLAALLRQTARLRAIELQLAAVYDLRGHAEAMRLTTVPGAATDCA